MSPIIRWFYDRTLRNVTAIHEALKRDCPWFTELPTREQWKMAYDFNRSRKDLLQEFRFIVITLAAIITMFSVFYKLL